MSISKDVNISSFSHFRILAGVLLLLGMFATNAFAQDAFMRPAIDTNTIKEDALQSFSNSFMEWSFTCQEIVTIKKRVCNLASYVYDENDQKAGSVLIATDTNNKIAMLIRITPPMYVDKPIVLSTQRSLTNSISKQQNYEKKILLTLCTTYCSALIKADDEVIYALNNNINVTLKVDRPEMPGRIWSDINVSKRSSTLLLKGTGFAQALHAALKN